MTNKLDDFYTGDTFRVGLTFEEDITGASIQMTLKTDPDDNDAAAVIGPNAGVLDPPDGNDDILGATVEFTPAETTGRTIGLTHYVDIELTEADGTVTTLHAQTIRPLRDVTHNA